MWNPTSCAYHPQAQGKVERSHGTLKNKLRYDILNCVEGDMPFFIFYTNETNEINDYANVYIQIMLILAWILFCGFLDFKFFHKMQFMRNITKIFHS